MQIKWGLLKVNERAKKLLLIFHSDDSLQKVFLANMLDIVKDVLLKDILCLRYKISLVLSINEIIP